MKDFFQPTQLDEEDRDVFEVHNTSHLELSLNILNDSLRMNTDGDAEIMESRPAPKETAKPAQTATCFGQKLEKLIERYQAIKAAKNGASSNSTERLKKIIESTRIPDLLKMSCLKREHDFVREYFELRNNNDLNMRKSIEKIFGGKRKVQHFLDGKKETWSDMSTARQETLFHIITKLKETKDVKDVSLISNGFVEAEVTQRNKSPVFASQPAYMMDSQLELPVFFENDSKYESQRNPLQVHNGNLAANSSTPIRNVRPKVVEFKSPSIDSPIKNSPLAKAFERCRRKNDELEKSILKESPSKEVVLAESKSSASTSKSEINSSQDYLKFLGLSCIDDLFADDDGEEEALPTNTVSRNPEQSEVDRSAPVGITSQRSNKSQPKCNNSAAKGMNSEISDLFADDSAFDGINFDHLDEIPATQFPVVPTAFPSNRPKPTQYTVTQIERICAEDDVMTTSSPSGNKENVPINKSLELNLGYSPDKQETDKPKKSFYIGSVSDLFADDSDWEEMELPEGKMVQKTDETVARSDSDCTEEYDFEDAIIEPQGKASDTKADTEFSKQLSLLSSEGRGEGEALRRHQSKDLFAVTDSSSHSDKSISIGAKEKLEQKESDNVIVPLSSGSTLPTISRTIPNMTKSSSLIATSSTSFIYKANNSPSVRTSSPKPNVAGRSEIKPHSIFNMSSSVTRNSCRSDQSGSSPKSLSSRSVSPPPSNPSNASMHHLDRSPSMLARRPNLSRLRAGGTTNQSSLSGREEAGSSPFLTCKPASNSLSKILQSVMCSSDEDFEPPANPRAKLSKLTSRWSDQFL